MVNGDKAQPFVDARFYTMGSALWLSCVKAHMFLCFTRERIRQIEAKALRKLKHPSRSRKLRSFLDI